MMDEYSIVRTMHHDEKPLQDAALLKVIGDRHWKTQDEIDFRLSVSIDEQNARNKQFKINERGFVEITSILPLVEWKQ